MLTLIRRTIEVLSPKYRRRVMILGVGALVSAVIDAAAFGLLYPFIQLVTAPKPRYNSTAIDVSAKVFGVSSQGIAGHHSLEVRLGFTILALFVISSVLGIALTWAQSRVVARSEADVSIRLFGRYLHAPYAEHLDRNSSELVRNVHNAVGDVHQLVLMSLLIIGSNLMTVVILACVMMIITPAVTIIAVIYFAFVSLLYVKVVSPRAQRAGKSYLEGSGNVIRVSQEGFGGIKSLQASDALDSMDQEFQNTKWDFARHRQVMTYYSQLPQYYLQSALIGGIVLFSLVTYLIGRHDVTALLGLLMAASIKLLPALYTTLSSINRIRNGQASLESIGDDLRRLDPHLGLIEAEPLLADTPPAALPDSVTDRIEFVDVTFQYPRGDAPVLDHMSFVIPKGQSIGLVGRSGAGKTTVVDLLLGLFPMTSGYIAVDGVALDETTVKEWRRRVGYVPQEVFLLDGSIRDNIRFSRLGKPPPIEELWGALERAQIAEFVASLPDGIETVVGERGVRLSGGQRQRLGIARALYRDPEVLILDEATSALDTATEAAVADTIASLRGTLTMVIIAHRLSTVRDCDLLLLMEDGRVVAQGDFDTLRRESDLFSEFARLSHIEA